MGSKMAGGSASALSLSRPARASPTLRPAGSLSRPRRPLSLASSPASCPAQPLARYRNNRQLSGWIPPTLVIRAFGAHGQKQTSTPAKIMSRAEDRRGTRLLSLPEHASAVATGKFLGQLPRENP